MTKEEDLLFCQIAIQTGMVNQDDAKKCLSLAQKLENEGKRRPSIGAIFVKTNLISQPNVQKLQQAVRKRQQVGGATAARGAGRRGGVRGGRRARGDEPEARRRAMPKRGGGGRRRVSQGTAWLYIGSGVVFLVLIISMGYMLVRAAQKGAGTGGDAPTVTDSGGAGTSVPPPTVKPIEKPVSRRMDRDSDTFKEFANDHRFALTDSKQFMGDGMYGQALSLLRRVLSAKEPYYQREPELRQKIEEEIEKVEKKIVEIVDEAIAEAQRLAKDGNKSEGERILSDLKQKLARQEKYASKIDSAITGL